MSEIEEVPEEVQEQVEGEEEAVDAGGEEVTEEAGENGDENGDAVEEAAAGKTLTPEQIEAQEKKAAAEAAAKLAVELERKRRTLFYVPATQEFKQDMLRWQMARSVVMGPINLKDLQARKLAPYLQHAKNLSMGFQKAPVGNDYKGYIQMIFGSEDEASSVCSQLEKFKEGVTVKQCQETEPKASVNNHIDLSALKEYKEMAGEPAYRQETTMCLTDLAEEVTEEEIKELFPEAKLVYLVAEPKKEEPEPTPAPEEEVKTEAPAEEVKTEETNGEAEGSEAAVDEEKKEGEEAETKEGEEAVKKDEKPEKKPEVRKRREKRYAYIVFNTPEEAKEYEHKTVTLHETEYTVWELEYLPPVDQVIRHIDNEHIPSMVPGQHIPQDRKNKLFQLKRQALHYMRCDYLPEHKKSNLHKRLDMLNRVVDTRPNQQKRRGGPGGGRGGGDGPAAKRGRGNNGGFQQRGGMMPRGGGGYGGPPRGGYGGGGMYGGGGYGGGGFQGEWGYGGGYGGGGYGGGGYGGAGFMPFDDRFAGGRGGPRGGRGQRGGRGRGGGW